MALMKCIDCGSMVSEHARECKVCGCPRSFFEYIDMNLERGKRSTQEIPTSEVGKVKEDNTFDFGDYQISYPKAVDISARLFGVFFSRTLEIISVICDEKGNEREEMTCDEDVKFAVTGAFLQSVDRIESLFGVIEGGLYICGISMPSYKFRESNVNHHTMDYVKIFQDLIEGDCTKREKELLKEINDMGAGISKYKGPGFNIPKGLFEYLKNRRSATGKYDHILETYTIYLSLVIHGILMNAYYAYMELAHAIGLMEQKVTVNYTEAWDHFQDILRDKSLSSSERNAGILRCLELYPAEEKFYNELSALMSNHIEETEAFKDYWGLDTAIQINEKWHQKKRK